MILKRCKQRIKVSKKNHHNQKIHAEYLEPDKFGPILQIFMVFISDCNGILYVL